MGKTKASKSEPSPQPNNANANWREVEYKECSEDWRHRDRLIWATLPVAATVGAVTVGVAFNSTLGIRLCVLLIGVFLMITMLTSLMKHRLFQEGSEQQIQSLREPLKIEDWDRKPRIHRPRRFVIWNIIQTKKTDAALTSWARQRIGFKWDIKPSNKIDALFTRWAWRGSGFKWILRGTIAAMLIMMGLAALTVFQLIVN